MNNRIFDIILLCALSLILGSCKKSTPVSTSTTEQKSVVPVVCVYTLGAVNVDLQRAMMDSLRVHYPKCRMAGNIHLPDSALTTKRNDHKRYRADVLNKVLCHYKSDSTIVVGLTQADIGLDNFRGRAQGLRHCPDIKCMMQNAKGGNPFRKTNVFCDKCKKYMESKHWKL